MSSPMDFSYRFYGTIIIPTVYRIPIFFLYFSTGFWKTNKYKIDDSRSLKVKDDQRIKDSPASKIFDDSQDNVNRKQHCPRGSVRN